MPYSNWRTIWEVRRWGIVDGIVWNLPPSMFETLGGRINGSVAVSLLPVSNQESPSADLQPGIVRACATLPWTPAEETFHPMITYGSEYTLSSDLSMELTAAGGTLHSRRELVMVAEPSGQELAFHGSKGFGAYQAVFPTLSAFGDDLREARYYSRRFRRLLRTAGSGGRVMSTFESDRWWRVYRTASPHGQQPQPGYEAQQSQG